MARPKVLIIEDERPIATLLAQICKGLDVEVQTAHDGAQGMEIVREATPQLVLLDMIMPIMSGEEVLRALAEEGFLPSLKVIVLSTKENLAELESLPSGHLVKPFEPSDVKRLVRDALSLS